MYIFLLVFIILYALFLDKPKGFISRLFFSTVIFLGVNTLYFFLAYVFSLSLSLNTLFFIHLLYSILWYLIIRKNLSAKNKKEIIKLDLTDLMLVVITALTCGIFFLTARSFDNGFRLPIFSYTQDAANHLLFVKEILDQNKLVSAYPLGFHSNVWLAESIANAIAANYKYDQIFFVNVFSIFSIFVMILLTGLFYLNVDNLLFIKSDKRNIFLNFLLVFLVAFFGMVIPYYLLADGFYSMLFNQMFLLALIFFLTNSSKKTQNCLAITPLIIGFIYSYIFFIPGLIIFFAMLTFQNRRNPHIYFLLISLIFSFLTTFKFLQIENKALWLASAYGAFADYSFILVLAYFLPAVFYLSSSGNTFKKNNILISLSISFIIFAITLALYQVITTGSLQYSFYKTLTVVMVSFAIFSIIAIYQSIEKIYLKLNFSKSVLFLFFVGTFYSLWKFIPLMSDYSYQNFTSGGYNFFENNKEKYNAISFVYENFNDFDQYIYIDQNFSSSQWGSRLLDINGLNSVNGYAVFDQKIDFFIELIENLEENRRLLIVDPGRYLQINCQAEEFLVSAMNKKTINQVSFYPYFDLDTWRSNCEIK